MTDVVYAKTEDFPIPGGRYLVCKEIDHKWQIMASYDCVVTAQVVKNNSAEEQLINGEITDPLCWQVFHRDFVKVRKVK